MRVVFAPEQQIAFFGGDPDNFEYPRFDFDVYFFRVYEQGRPARVEHFLNWSRTAAGENELVLVAGHPRQTERLATVAAMTYPAAKIGLPHVVQELYRLEVELSAWSGRSEANAFKAQELLFQIQDGRKARDGALAGLLDPSLMTKKREEEAQFRSAIAGDPALKETGRTCLAADCRGAKSPRAPFSSATRLSRRRLASTASSLDIPRTLVRAPCRGAELNPIATASPNTPRHGFPRIAPILCHRTANRQGVPQTFKADQVPSPGWPFEAPRRSRIS